MVEWLVANAEWFFSGLGVVLITGIAGFIFSKGKTENAPPSTREIIIHNHANINNTNSQDGETKIPSQSIDGKFLGSARIDSNPQSEENVKAKRTLESYKNETKILFIDDDARFKVAKILTKSGWVHTKLIKDASTLDDADIVSANILFIDVQGVGVEMGFTDEGLGLALAVKEKYPEKKVVIYSAETKGDRFHAALRKADSFLPKNADPYEFQKIVEDFTVGSS